MAATALAPNRPLALGARTLWPPVVLAPMAGVTDTPFRVLCARRGAPLCVNEMVTARAIVERHPPTLRMLGHHEEEPIRSLQFYGTEPESLDRAIRWVLERYPVDHIDLNFGCPAPKVTRLGGGAALPYKRPLFTRMVGAAVGAANGVPVSVKFRMGIDDAHLTHLDAGRLAQREGAVWVALHARTAEQLYAPAARWSAIAELVDHVDIPVLGNGDLFDVGDVHRMMADTACAGVVIGRGCLGKPWLFSDMRAAFAGEPVPEPPRLAGVVSTMLEHADLVIELQGAGGLVPFRKHVHWYLRGYPVGGAVRRAASSIVDRADLDALVATLDLEAELVPGNERLVRSHSGGPRRPALPQDWLDDPWEDPHLDPAADAVVSGG